MISDNYTVYIHDNPLCVRFNGEAVPDCPFVCRVSDTSQVTVELQHLELMPVGEPAMFHIQAGHPHTTPLITLNNSTNWPVCC